MTTPAGPDGTPDEPGRWAPPDPSSPGPGTAPPGPGTPPGTDAPPRHRPSVHGPSSGTPARTNRLAIGALVSGLLGLVPFAMGLGVAVLVRTGRRGTKGRGLAVTGLAASGIWVVAGVAVLVLGVDPAFLASRDDSGRAARSVRSPAAELRSGDCFTGLPETRMTLVTATPCTRPHDREVVAVPVFPDVPYPGDDIVADEADRLCSTRTTHLQKSRHFDDLGFHVLTPDQAAWESGNRQVMCTVHYTGPGTLTTPLAETIDTSLKTYGELAVGDCVERWRTDVPIVPVVDCTAPHRLQVFAVFDLPMPGLENGTYSPSDYPPYPGEKKVERPAVRGCEKRSRSFRTHPPRVPVDVYYAWPDEENWDSGITQVVCMLRAVDGPLKRSLVPR